MLTTLNNYVMKRILSFFPIITLSIVLFTSCGKEYSSTTGSKAPVASTKVKTYTEDITSNYLGNSYTTYDLSYDATDRLVSIISRTNSGDKSLYTFPSNNLFKMDLYNSGNLAIHEDFFLNGNLFVDSTFQYNDTQDSSTEKYVYNANNQLITIKEYNYSRITGSELVNVTTNTYDGNGDLTESSDLNSNVDTYEYYLDLIYATPIVPGPVNINSTKKGHLVKKHTIKSNNFLIGSADYTYTFDSSNRISTEKAVGTDGSVIIKTYTYF
jgi:hypothetical protein